MGLYIACGCWYRTAAAAVCGCSREGLFRVEKMNDGWMDGWMMLIL
jgi:hypothetical protein